ncbi:MAG TPA: TolC family protein, partial [Alphaproteobacteria bacterium]|nr:TolC family protein [Alphaproteobacteria bacterium]
QEKFRQSQAEALAANQHAFEIAQQRYKEGLTSFLDVLDAQRTLNMSAMQMNDATAKSSANLIAVYKSLGGGWKSK